MKFNCGHCGELTSTTVQAENSYDNYPHNNGYDIPCQHCGKYNRIYFESVVRVSIASPIADDEIVNNFSDDDFDEPKSRKRPKKRSPKVDPDLDKALNFLMEKQVKKRRRGSTRS